MAEIIITTRRGVYGRVNVTLFLPMKLSMLAWAKRSGMKKAEFLRMRLRGCPPLEAQDWGN